MCLVGARQQLPEGTVDYDSDRCKGCRYCLVACPYGIPRYEWEDAVPHVRKCTLCADRIAEGKVPACVEVCPTGARIFGDVRTRSSPLVRFTRFNEIQVLKPQLNTEPKVYYANLDGEVR